jgi:hypothetical protein
MNTRPIESEILAALWKIPVIAAIYFAGTVIGGALVNAVGLMMPVFPEQVYSPSRTYLASVVLSAAVYLLARGVRGTKAHRFLLLFAFTYVSFCVNNQIEGAIFTTVGGFSTMLLFFIVPCALVAGVAAWLVQSPASETMMITVFADRSMGSWLRRAALAWFAFPVIYYVFGAVIYPFVADGYEGGELALEVPSQATILGAVTLRSLLFLLVSIPIIIHWSRSRRTLILSLGAALTAMVGVVGLVESAWLPLHMRVVHGLEIAADSLVHAWVMVALLVPKRKEEQAAISTASAE